MNELDDGIKMNGECATVLKIKEKMRMQRKQQMQRGLFVVMMLAGVTIGMYFLFRAFGIDVLDSDTTLDLEGQLLTIALVFIMIYFIQSMTLNLIPGTTTVFISGIAFALFDGANSFFTAYLISVVAVLIASVGLYFLGRYGGRTLLYWLFDKETLDKRLDWFAVNGSKGVPWLFLIPMFPTDLLCVTCGAAKMSFWQYMLIVCVFRPIEIALLLVYPLIIGSDIVQSMETWERILVVNVLVLNVVILVMYHKALLNIFNRTFNRRLREQERFETLLARERERKAENKVGGTENDNNRNDGVARTDS